ncbi:MAG TPA: hypothetical protein VHB47_20300 [Thermoanaerobaculia bacterium]|jgi:hypothetical protein|nr:hypothetical protein [Thermoanaerobaculia bacterium]
MLLSLPANPVPSELYQYFAGGTSPIWLPWYVWGGGVYATKYGYDTNKYFGYLGTISVPLAGTSVVVKSLRMTGAVTGKSGSTEGALVIASLYQRTANISSPIATILVDRRNVSVTNPFVNITATVSGGGFTASASANSLAIEILGEGQGIATIHGLVVDL